MHGADADSSPPQDELQAAWTWIKETMQFDKWDRVKLLMLGSDRLSVRTYFDAWVALLPGHEPTTTSPTRAQLPGYASGGSLQEQVEITMPGKDVGRAMPPSAEAEARIQELEAQNRAMQAQIDSQTSQLAQQLPAPGKERMRLGAQAPGPAGGKGKRQGVGFSDDVDEIGLAQGGQDDRHLQAKINFVERIVKHWRMQGLGKAFDSWHSHAREQVRCSSAVS